MAEKKTSFYCQLDYEHVPYPSPVGVANGNVANNENAILTILFLLRDKKHTTADTGDARSTLDNLEGRTQGVASGREGTGNLSVSTFGLDNHTTQIERVLHQFASFLNGHPL